MPLTIDVVVCIHGAMDAADACVSSVVKAGGYARLWLIDDRNTAADRARMEAWQGPGATIIDAAGPGYTRAANTGLRVSTADYVCLLNSDTEVYGDWLERMLRAFSASPATGLVGPWSNAATWQSLPRDRDWRGRWLINELHGQPHEIDQRMRAVGQKLHPQVGVLNGFCLMLSRAVLDEVGVFDEALFPDGYGEEDDYCLRAAAAGFVARVAGDVFVYHRKSASYGARRAALSRAGHQALIERHGAGTLRRLIRDMRRNAELKAARRVAAGVFS